MVVKYEERDPESEAVHRQPRIALWRSGAHVQDPTPAKVERGLERGKKRLGTDYLSILVFITVKHRFYFGRGWYGTSRR